MPDAKDDTDDDNTGGGVGFANGEERMGEFPSDGTLPGAPKIVSVTVETTIRDGDPLNVSCSFTDDQADVSVVNFGIAGELDFYQVALGSLTAGVRAGKIDLTLSPRKYVPGSYLFALSLQDAAGNVSEAFTTPFSILGPDGIILNDPTTDTDTVADSVTDANQTEWFTVQPSAMAVTFAGQGITVTLPGGLLTSEQTLKITSVDNPPPPIFKGLEPGGAYDIQLGDLQEFDQELTLRMKYDPSALRTDLPIEQLISASYFDTLQECWVAVPSTLDTVNHEVVIKTRHLSMFSWFMKAVGYDVFFKNNFYVVYNKAEVTDPNFLMYYTNPDHSNYADINVPNFVEDVTAFLIDAWRRYMDDYKFTAPAAPVDIYVGTDLSPLAEKFTGIILISLLSMTPEQLKLITAHELFHRVQNAYYYDIGGMSWLTWWLEATADYAGDHVAWQGLNLMGGEGGIKRNYLEAPLTDTGEVHNDGYATAHFVKYLVDNGASFKGMWEAIAAYDSSLLLLGLNAYLEGVHGVGSGLATQYGNFARYFLFDANSPMPAITDSLYSEVAAYRTTIADGIQETAFSLQGGYTAKLWGIWFAAGTFDATTTDVAFKVSVDSALPDRVQLSVYVLKGDTRLAGGGAPVGTISGTTISVEGTAEEGDAVYVLAVNNDGSTQTVNVKIEIETEPSVPDDCYMNLTFDGTLPVSNLTNPKATYVDTMGVTSVKLSSEGTGASFVLEIVTVTGGVTAPGAFDVGVPNLSCAPACGSYTVNSDVYKSVSQSGDPLIDARSSITIDMFGMNPGERISGSFVFYMAESLLDSETDGPLRGEFSCVITE